jgi:hypothetical protein
MRETGSFIHSLTVDSLVHSLIRPRVPSFGRHWSDVSDADLFWAMGILLNEAGAWGAEGLTGHSEQRRTERGLGHGGQI